MPIRTAYARYTSADARDNADKAVARIRADLAGMDAALVVFYAATNYHPDTLAAAMQAAFPAATTMGCTTAGEAANGEILDASVVAMAFSADEFDHCRSALVLASGGEAPGDDVFASADAAMRHLSAGLGLDIDYKSNVGFMLADRISFFSEALLERIGELTDVIFVGGFAGDDYRFDNSQTVFYRGRACRDAAVLALWQPRRGFSLLKTQAVGLTDTRLIITKADEYRRIVWEFNGEPAAPLLARLLNVPVEALDVRHFDDNPLALIVDGEPFLRAMVRTVDNQGITMFAAVKEGSRLTLTRAGDILATTGRDLREIQEKEGPFSAILHINCASRYTTLDNWRQKKDFAALFKDIPNIAFSSYGEIYVGIVAMTSTMILFK